jgi:enediyne biosynthesis protein E4
MVTSPRLFLEFFREYFLEYRTRRPPSLSIPARSHSAIATVRHTRWLGIISRVAVILVMLAGCRSEPPHNGSGQSAAEQRSGSNESRSPEPGGDLASGNSARGSGPDTIISFAEVATDWGVQFTYQNGEEANRGSILESVGGGVAIWDFDRDGQWDLFFPGGGKFTGPREMQGEPSALFRRVGDSKYADVTTSSQLEFLASDPRSSDRRYTHGVSIADFDGDGFPDLVVTGYGGIRLYHNQGDGTLLEMTEASAIADDQWSTSAAWLDFDGDGNLDLYVVRYVDWSFDNDPLCAAPEPGLRETCPPSLFEGLSDSLYRSRGDGTFEEVSEMVGLRPGGKGLGVVAADLDRDGHIDLYVANDTEGNFHYRNRGNGTFEEIGLTSGTSLSHVGSPDGSMGVDVGDFNRNGLPDIWVANFERESFALYRNMGGSTFRHVSQPMGITAVGGLYVGWGTAFVDLNLNGFEDLFAANGHVVRFPINAPRAQSPLLFENQRGTRFRNVAPQAGSYLQDAHFARGAAFGDLTGNGRIDVVISHVNQPAAILQNTTSTPNHWFGLQLVGTQSNRDAIGAIVTLTAASGTQMRQLKGGASFASSSQPGLHFGLGPDRVIEQVEIRWPSGLVQRLKNPAPNQWLRVVEPHGE